MILVVVIFWKVIGGTAPNGQGFTLKPFVPASGTTIGAVAFASVFGLLSFGGFEGAAALGEETNNPRRNIPLAIAVAVAFCGVFYTIVMLAQSLGFGIDAAGIKAFSTLERAARRPLEDVRRQRHGGRDQLRRDAERVREPARLRRGASRILFALGRDGFITRRLGDASERTGSPANALGVVMIFGLAVTILLRLNGTSAVNAFFYPGTVGVLSMLVAYFVIQIGAAKFLHLEKREPRWRAIIVVLADRRDRLHVLQAGLAEAGLPVRPLPADDRAAGPCVGAAITIGVPGADAPDRPRPLRGGGAQSGYLSRDIPPSSRAGVQSSGMAVRTMNPVHVAGTCAVAATAEIIGAKWTALLVHDLSEGPRRFSELERSCQGISPRTLAERLRALEADGFLERQSYPETPPRVEYSLTEKGAVAPADHRRDARVRPRLAPLRAHAPARALAASRSAARAP